METVAVNRDLAAVWTSAPVEQPMLVQAVEHRHHGSRLNALVSLLLRYRYLSHRRTLMIKLNR